MKRLSKKLEPSSAEKFLKNLRITRQFLAEFDSPYYRKLSNGLEGYLVKLADGYEYIKLETGCYIPFIKTKWVKI